jgi:hypothetical protein
MKIDLVRGSYVMTNAGSLEDTQFPWLQFGEFYLNKIEMRFVIA